MNSDTQDGKAGAPGPRPPLNDAQIVSIIRSAMEAIVTIDESQRIVIFNPAAEQVFGCSAADAIGTSLERFIPLRFRDRHAHFVRQFGVTGVSERRMGQQRVLHGLRADGEEFPIEASISQVSTEGGKLYTVMLRDVTERVRAEQALQASQEELRQLSANIQNVREEEKMRIARELHDDLGQQLTALKMDVSLLDATLKEAGYPLEVGEQIRAMHGLIDATVASVRRIAADLRPVMLDDLGPIAAIEWLAADFGKRYGIAVRAEILQDHIDFSPAGGTALFRIVQEALTNVARHARATEVELSLTRAGDACVLRVRDNGQGMDLSAGRKSHSFGLLGIRERVRLFGGTVKFESSPGQGCTLEVGLALSAIAGDQGDTA
jgi:PAS domain S-box-containing protein